MSEATTTSTGAMTATDKAKLDRVAYNATSNAPYTSTPAVNGTASAGTVANYSRGDHVHPLQTTVSGNAGTATKFANARTIALSGGATGTATSFDGSANITIPVTGLNMGNATAGTLPIARGGTGATDAATARDNLGVTQAIATAVDDIEVGARNLLVGSSTYTEDSPYKLTGTKDDTYVALTNLYCDLEAGVKYTITAKTDGVWSNHAIGAGGNKCSLWLINATNGLNYCLSTSGKASWSFTPTKTLRYNVRLNVYASGDVVNFWDIQVERGNKATDYTPPPEDIDAEIETKKTDEYSLFIDDRTTATTGYWHKMLTCKTNGYSYTDINIIVSVIQLYANASGARGPSGTLLISVRQEANGAFNAAATKLCWLDAHTDISNWLNYFAINVVGDSTGNFVEFYIYNKNQYAGYKAYIISKSIRSATHSLTFTGEINSPATTTLTALPVNGNIVYSTSEGHIATAAKLTTARTINGTSFDGTSNITTANWGTARTLTIGNTGKSVNGSANVAWTLSEIGAAATSHTHDYLPLSGGTVTGTINSNGTALANGALSTNLNSSTWLFANQGRSILNSTNTAGGYTSLFKTNSTNGCFTGGSHQTGMYLSYTAADTITAGTNSTTKQAKLLDESGNSTFPGTVTAPTFAGALSGNAATATKLATARTLSYTGDVTGSMSFDGSANASTALTLSNSGATAGSYGPTAAATLSFGGSVNVPQVTVDAKGRATSIVNRAITLPTAPTTVSGNAGTATKLATARTLSYTGDATGSMSFDGSANASTALTLSNSGVTAGSYGPTAATALGIGYITCFMWKRTA